MDVGPATLGRASNGNAPSRCGRDLIHRHDAGMLSFLWSHSSRFVIHGSPSFWSYQYNNNTVCGALYHRYVRIKEASEQDNP
ncbi:hypothetical protein DAEQUDRAFT_370333 [Daedalea quercina L-15889]|uniref:Uncharacterized protein n=1 Tax=Daedalea quercina L-15889 TaxID=1314783 RepID=A0A165PB33_9APHY|nr:hypothetical protein DAEQUDRAFT_370333 [Daedalea quercina L-15889]